MQAVVCIGVVPEDSLARSPVVKFKNEHCCSCSAHSSMGLLVFSSCNPRPQAKLWIDGACEWDKLSDALTCGFRGVLIVDGAPMARGFHEKVGLPRREAAPGFRV